MSVIDKALSDFLLDFRNSYESIDCDVCGEKKWLDSPFCRKCSIQLQRAKLIAPMTQLTKVFGRPIFAWPSQAVWTRFRRRYDVGEKAHPIAKIDICPLVWYAKRWDLCRDYLVNRRRENANTKNRRDRDDHGDE